MSFHMPSNRTGNLSNSFYKVDITLRLEPDNKKGIEITVQHPHEQKHKHP